MAEGCSLREVLSFALLLTFHHPLSIVLAINPLNLPNLLSRLEVADRSLKEPLVSGFDFPSLLFSRVCIRRSALSIRYGKVEITRLISPS